MDINRLLSPAEGTDDLKQERRRDSSPRMSLKHRAFQNDAQQSRTIAQNDRATSLPNTTSSEYDHAIKSPRAARAQEVALQHRPSLTHGRSSRQHESHANHMRPPAATNRTLSNRSLATVAMDEGPIQMPTPRDYSSNDMSEEEQMTVTALLNHLKENQYDYPSHTQLIKLLHSGFVTFTQSGSEPSTYGMLPELRQAREAMDSRFAVGEVLWLDWISDETILAKTAEERVDVVQLLQRAVQDEPASTWIWQAYLDYLSSNYNTCHEGDTDPADEDVTICQAVFTKDMLIDALEQASAAVRWRVDTSHEIWSRYLRFLQQECLQPSSNADDRLTTSLKPKDVEQIFFARLQEPHANMDDTVQLFWPVLNYLYNDHWEEAMAGVQEAIAPARAHVKLREKYEIKLSTAIGSGDQQTIIEEYTRYLKWEAYHKQNSNHDKDMHSALYERALLSFPTNAEWWIEYIDFVISQEPSSHNPSKSLLPLIERATKHCPWSGELWARRIMRADYERQSYEEIEATKHRATNSGLLVVGGMEDLLKVLIQWCSYLRRQAFSATATEDNKDLTEVGITMALEDMQQAGQRLYGDAFEGDPLFRLEQIHIKFLSEARRMDDARAIFRRLIPKLKSSYDFWQKYYVWEITLWIHDRVNDRERIETTETSPQLATLIVEEALSQNNLDWPDKVADMYITHFLWNESVEKLQAATVAVSQFRRKIALKRAKEAKALAGQQAQEVQEQAQAYDVSLKRKRDADDEVANHKRAKTTEPEELQQNGTTHKRDREHLSIALSNLALDTTEKDVRNFLQGCGDILSIDIAPAEGSTTFATVEFAEREDMEFAKSRSGKMLKDREVRIQNGKQSTLYVTNYPPEYDEDAVRKLFMAYGDITSVRFPSLKQNNRRRFCYVQFSSHQQAKAAEKAMDGKKLDGMHTLVAKISDPNAKKDRGGAQAEGRELFIKNVDDSIAEEDVKTFFERFGSVQSIKLLRNIAKKRLGNGFVVYSSADEAAKAIEEADNKPLGDRILHVTLSTPKGATVQASKQNIIVKHGDSDAGSTGRRGSDVSMVSTQSREQDSHKTVRERRVALFHVPSTVTDARITAEMENYGPVTMIQLRRGQDAAIVEFNDVKTAFDVRAGINFPALGPECKSGDVADLLRQGSVKQKSVAPTFRPATISRPAQRGGRRGGLGFKRGGLAPAHSAEKMNGDSGAAKSNKDFKAIFAQGKPAEETDKMEE